MKNPSKAQNQHYSSNCSTGNEITIIAEDDYPNAINDEMCPMHPSLPRWKWYMIFIALQLALLSFALE